MARIYKSQAGQQAVEQLYRDVLQRWPVANRHVVIPTRQGDTNSVYAVFSSVDTR